MNISAELLQNIRITIELTFLHNYLAIFYFIGLILSVVWSLYRPSRAATMAMVGFGLLLFSFEYSKHILEPLKEQTTNSLITMQEHNKVRRILDLSMVRLMPTGLLISGFSSLIISGVLFLRGFFTQKKKS